MRFLISMVFVGMLALSSQVIAKEVSGADAQEIMYKGREVGRGFTENGHETRWFYNGLWACLSKFNFRTTKLEVKCQNIE